MPRFVRAEMPDAAIGRIHAVEIRCACGASFDLAELYTPHKKTCGTRTPSREKNKVLSSTPTRPVQRRVIVPAGAFVSTVPGEREACCCGRMFGSLRALRQHGRYCAVYRQQSSNMPENVPREPVESRELSADTGSSEARERKDSVTSAGSTTSNTQSSCSPRVGQGRMRMNDLPSSQSASDTTALSPNTVPATGNRSATGNELPGPLDDPLLAAFASLHLGPVRTQFKPSVTSFVCTCGCDCASQNALEQHKRDFGCGVQQGGKGKGKKKGKMPRVQYERDEDFAAFVAIHARQGQYTQ